MCKKILIISLSVFIAVSGFLTGFFSVGLINVYAINDDPLWQPLNSENELVEAFQDYCKSRDLTIEGSVADAVTTATTGSFNGICNRLGIDITALQADIKKSTDQAGNIQWLFNSNGITAYNRIFAQFLQDNELQVGDTVSDLPIYEGYELNGSLLYITTSNAISDDTYPSQYIVQRGSYYKYSNSQIINSAGGTINFTFGSNTYTYYVFNYSGTTYDYYTAENAVFLQTDPSYYNRPLLGATASGNIVRRNVWNYTFSRGCPCIYKGLDSNTFTLGFYWYRYDSVSDKTKEGIYKLKDIPNNSTSDINPCNVYITTNNTTINNNNYEGDTIINNYGTPSEPDEPEEPKNPNDIIHNVPSDPLGPDGIDLPDFDIPNLPIGDLSEKFPFSIPWDLVAFYAMLDAEPQAPRFNGTMDLTLVQWNYDIDLSPFDSAADLCRKLQFGLFVVGLIVASRSIIRG